jgi:hypothetical protein
MIRLQNEHVVHSATGKCTFIVALHDASQLILSESRSDSKDEPLENLMETAGLGPSESICILIGIAMDLTATTIVYSPWGKTIRGTSVTQDVGIITESLLARSVTSSHGEPLRL